MTQAPPPDDLTRILDDHEVAAMTNARRAQIARDFPGVPLDLLGNQEHRVRLMSLGARFKQAREASGATIKELAAALKVPQYRLKSIEEVRLHSIEGPIIARYGAHLGLEAWLATWIAANGLLAAELGIGPPVIVPFPLPAAGDDRALEPAPPPPRDMPDPLPQKRVSFDGAPVAELVYRFRITLMDVEPPIWRLIEVPAWGTFWSLHVAIQNAMGWTDSHLHAFTVPEGRSGEVELGFPDPDGYLETKAGWRRLLKRHLKNVGQEFLYTYDFGDNWEHVVTLEGILLADPAVTYPRCLDGARRCPPEDCGGTWGYEDFLAAVADPHHEEHESTLEWCGGAFDPEAFVPGEVVFEDPLQRLREVGEGW